MTEHVREVVSLLEFIILNKRTHHLTLYTRALFETTTNARIKLPTGAKIKDCEDEINMKISPLKLYK